MYHHLIHTWVKQICLFFFVCGLFIFESSSVQRLIDHHDLSVTGMPCDQKEASPSESSHQKDHLFSCHGLQCLPPIKWLKHTLTFEPILGLASAYLKDSEIFIKDVFLDTPFQPPKAFL